MAAHLFDLHVVYGTELPSLWMAGKRGDYMAACRHSAVVDTIVKCSRFADTDEPMLCLLCDHRFTETVPPIACVIVVTQHDSPQEAMCNVVCDDCEQKPDLMPRAVAQYHKYGVISNGRIVQPPSQPGHA